MFNNTEFQDPTGTTDAPPSSSTAPTGGGLPAGWTVNPDGSMSGPNGQTIAAPPPGYTRGPDGVVTYNGYNPTTGQVTWDPNQSAITTDPSQTPGVRIDQPTPPPNPNPPPPGPGGPGGPTSTTNPGGPTTGSLIAPFPMTGAAPGPGQTISFPGAPSPQPLPTMGGSVTTIPGQPAFPSIPAFRSPTMGEAMQEDGYQFTRDQGQHQLTNWLAAHGTFNDSSAAEALTDYGQHAAATQYQNVWNRAYAGYNTNVQTQYVDPWQAGYQGWLQGTVNPTMTNFQTGVGATQHANDMNWQNAFNTWLQDWNVFKDQRDSTFNKQFQVATA